MKKKKCQKYKSTALGVLHESMQDLRDINLIDAETMRDFDKSCFAEGEVNELGAVRPEVLEELLDSPQKPTPEKLRQLSTEPGALDPQVYKSKLCVAIHETAQDFYESGLIDKKTMDEFDMSCLVAPPVKKEE